MTVKSTAADSVPSSLADLAAPLPAPAGARVRTLPSAAPATVQQPAAMPGHYPRKVHFLGKARFERERRDLALAAAHAAVDQAEQALAEAQAAVRQRRDTLTTLLQGGAAR